ncbi:MAG: hypothetical protein KA314_19705 [Chloroflexi bacterium]|nr:hypothetical protein [Chloroflexota bacterium]MBP8058061.1 hypothetical protein [Chloroflexota bacterium]
MIRQLKGLLWMLVLMLVACTPNDQVEPTVVVPTVAAATLPPTPTLAATLATGATATPQPLPPTPEPVATEEPRSTPTSEIPVPVEAYSQLLQMYITLPAAAPEPPPIWQKDNNVLNQYILAVTNTLNFTQANPEAFRAQVLTWGPLTNPDTPAQYTWLHSADLDNDGTNELLARVPQLTDNGLFCDFGFCAGMVILFEPVGSLYVPEYAFPGDPEFQNGWLDNPIVYQVVDLNSDGLFELILQQEMCGAHTCYQTLLIGHWDGQTWQNMVGATPINQSYSTIVLEDRDGDGLTDIAMTGGAVGSVGGGLQRAHTLVFSLQNGLYELAQDIPLPDPHPYYLMMDAYYALKANDPATAELLANQVLALTPAQLAESMLMDPVAQVRVPTYAAIELMLVYALRGNGASIQALLPTLAPYDTGDNPYLAAATLFADTYAQTGDAAASCQAMSAVITALPPEQTQFFEWVGYNTELIPVGEICPLP